MADSNDDLLEDGDLSETNFDELDLAEEDALLADDEEKPIKTFGDSGEKMGDDDDYIEMGVDEDLQFHEDEALENGTTFSKRKPIEINIDNDDSDDNSGGERTRFKSERKITTTTSTRNASAIPETLDAVALRNPVKLNQKPNNHRGKPGRGGSHNRRFFPNQPNIHVNPHFRPRIPLGGPPHMWNSGFQGQQPHPPFQPPHLPPYGGFQPPAQPPPWNDQGYYNMPPGPPQYNQPMMDNNYYGAQEGFYSNQQNYPPQQPPLPQPQMGYGDNFYQGPPASYQPHFPPGPGPQMGPPRMRQPFNMGFRPPFNQNKSFQARPQKREQFIPPPKTLQAKQPKFDNSNPHRVRSNLQEVKMVDSLPPDAVIEEEDEEMKAYRKKIEEQKKLREKILKEKEEKRLVAAQQKALETAVSNQGAPVKPTAPSSNEASANTYKNETKVVRVRCPDGKTVIKKLTLVEIKRLKKVPLAAKAALPTNPYGVPSCVVSVENLSASTTQKQLETMAGNVGPIEKVELDGAKKTAIIRFTKVESAKEFVTKYQRKMVDLSMIGVKFVQQD